VDRLEIIYLAGFPILHLLVTALPLLDHWRSSSATPFNTTDHFENATAHSGRAVQAESSAGMEFLPLLLTSVYCAMGLVWAFVKLGAIYLTDMVGIA
jgi:alpha-1,3-glucosyltransferase